jgi:SAM-dependent methyltransferase
MMAPRDKAEELRAQREAWDESAAAWDAWFPAFDATAAPVTRALVELAGVAPGQRVLDVGCGNGEPALTAARAVGASGCVLGIDVSEGMVARARERARRAGVGNVEFRVTDAESLASTAAFDAAVSRFALMLAPDPVAAAAAVQRLLRPGGRFAAAVWGEPGEASFCALVPAAIRRELALPDPPADAPGPMRLGAPGALADVLRAAGFARVEERTLGIEQAFDSVAQAMRFFREVSSTLRRLLAERTPAERERAWAAAERELVRHAGGDGCVLLPSTVRIAAGARGPR